MRLGRWVWPVLGQVPEGYEKVARDMSKGSSRSAYLCFKRSAGKEDPTLPLSEVMMIYGEEEPPGQSRGGRHPSSMHS